MHFASSREEELDSPRSTALYVVGITLLTDGSATQLDIIGGSSELADDVRMRLTELQRIWLADDPDNDLGRLALSSGDPIAVSPETLLLLALAGFAPDQESAVSPRLDYAAMTVSLAVPLSARALTSLRSQALALTADLAVADLIDGGAWGACLRLGGVTRAFGIAEDGGPWTVPMPTPGGRTRPFQLTNAGLAASSAQASRASTHEAGRPDLIVWAAVEAELAWHAQTLADDVVGHPQSYAMSRLRETSGSALFYRSDDQVAEVVVGPLHGRSRGHQARTHVV